MIDKKKKKPLVRSNSLKSSLDIEVFTHSEVMEKKELIQKILLKDIIEPNVHDRKSYNKDAINSLARNIKATKTLLQPIVVRKIDDKYERIIGFRRIEAVKNLGWIDIPAIILKDISNEQAMLIMLSENIQREDLNYFDQTVGLLEYISLSFEMSLDEVKKLLYHFRNIDAKRVSNSSKEILQQREKMEVITRKLGNITVASLINRLKIFSLKKTILDALKEGKITYTSAIELNKIDNEDKITEMINAMEIGELSLRDIKAYLKTLKKKKAHKKINYTIEKNDKGIVFSITDKLHPNQLKKLKKFLASL